MKNKGFTIIELLVIITMVTIFSAIMFADYGNTGKQFALDRSAEKLAQDLRRTQRMAIDALIGIDETTNGYGIYFDKGAGSETKYIIYRNNNVNIYYDAAEPADSIKETILIESGVKICDIKDNDVSEADNTISISFQPPDPINYIENNYIGHEASIILCSVDDVSQTKTVKINNTGRIEVAD